MKRKSVLFEWALSYLIVVLVPLLAVFINYHLNMKIIKKEVCNANDVVLDNLSNEIDRMIDEQKSIYSWLYTDAAFSAWVSHTQKDAKFYYDASRLVQQINANLKYSGLKNCLIYSATEDYIIGSGEQNGAQKAFANETKRVWDFLKMQYDNLPEYEDWVGRLKADYRGEILLERNLDISTDQECLIYANRLTLNGDKRINVFISVPLERITKLVEALEAKTYLIIICNDSMKVINDDGTISEPEIGAYICAGQSTFDTGQFMGLMRSSSHKGVAYCLLMDQSNYWKTSVQVRKWFVIVLLVTVSVAGGVIVGLLKNNFMPVSRLMEKTIGTRTNGNEFYQIELAYSRLKSENSSMHQIMQKQKNALLGSYLLAVMQGRRESFSENELAFFDLKEEDLIMLSGFDIAAEDELLHFAVDNVWSELMAGGHFFRVDDGRYLFYVYFIKQENVDSLLKKCDKTAAYMSSFFTEKWSVDLNFYRVVQQEGMTGLRKAYRDFLKSAEPAAGMEAGGGKEELRGIVADVLDYITEHYDDSSLNIAAIADAIDKNPKYIARVFKETVGEGILDYLNRVRIDKAKEIIATRRYTTEEAGALAGYASNQTFRRAFIKLVGMPPGKYMEELHGNRT